MSIELSYVVWRDRGCYNDTMNVRAMRPRSGSSAKGLLLTALGEFVLPHDGAAWTSTLVAALSPLGVDERNTRQALTRLADDDVIASTRVGRKARWRLTEHGHRLLTDGTKRIYEFGFDHDAWTGRWLVVICSVPEDQRMKRHQLRRQLEFAGFGFVGAGVAISPHVEREGAAHAILDELGLRGAALVLRAETTDFVSTDDLLGQAWDLEALAARYDAFVGAFGERLATSPEEHFVALLELVHHWRRFPFADPEIPHRLLPADWPAQQATSLFHRRHGDWAPGANEWYEQLEAAEGP